MVVSYPFGKCSFHLGARAREILPRGYALYFYLGEERERASEIERAPGNRGNDPADLAVLQCKKREGGGDE